MLLSVLLHQLHAALGAIARGIFHHFGVHGASVLMSLSAALWRRGRFATRHVKSSEAEGRSRQGCQYRFRFHNRVFLLLSVVCSVVAANDVFANSFLARVTGLARAKVTHSSIQTCPPAWYRRAWTETFADSGRCKSKTFGHRVRRGVRWLRPRSFRRWGLWSRISILSWSCFFLGCCCCHCLFILIFTLPVPDVPWPDACHRASADQTSFGLLIASRWQIPPVATP